jgi:hypothetical protein
MWDSILIAFLWAVIAVLIVILIARLAEMIDPGDDPKG